LIFTFGRHRLFAVRLLTSVRIELNVPDPRVPTRRAVNVQTPNVDVVIYPNPASTGVVNIQLKNIKINEQYQITVYDIDGKQVHYDQNVGSENYSINTLDWRNGFYLVKIDSEDGIGIHHSKILLFQ